MNEQSMRNHIIALTAIAILALALRLPFYTPEIYGSDAIYYTIGALGTHVAHPPGYVGYCAIGTVLDHVLGSVLHGYIIFNLICTLAAVLLIYPLAREMGFSSRAAVLSTLVYSLSICMLKFSLVITTYVPEAMMANAIALMGLKAIHRRSFQFALWATLIWSLGGALRPATTYLLAPLWLFIILKSDRRWPILLLHLLIAAPIVIGWSKANDYLLRAELGFAAPTGPQGIEGQMIMASSADAAGITANVQANAQTLMYHWPTAEIVHWIELKAHVNVIPKHVEWPTPSLKHAVVLIATYIAKFGFYLLLSLPMLLVIPLLPLVRKGLHRPDRLISELSAYWVIPPVLFFVFAHFGVFGYFAMILAVPVILIIGALADAQPSQSEKARTLLRIAIGLSVVGAVIWVVGVPMRSDSKIAHVANLLVLSNTGPAVRECFVTGRVTAAESDDITARFYGLKTDDQLIVQLKKENLFPNAYYPIRDARP